MHVRVLTNFFKGYLIRPTRPSQVRHASEVGVLEADAFLSGFHQGEKNMISGKRLSLVAAILVLAASPGSLTAQSSNATLSGSVSDSSGALIPGVSVTATNAGTSVATTGVSNEAGVYTLPGLLPGVYRVSATLPGFQTQTFTDVQLGNAAQVRLNFTLSVATVNTAVEVAISADRLLLESSSSVGQVLTEQTVRELPVIGVMGNDVLSLIRVMAGVTMTTDPIFGANSTELAGVSASNIQIQRDGVDAGASGRWSAGVQGATIMNPDLVGEIRMVLAPVDAEVGRGNSQIQVQTRSGTNSFTGSAVWNIQNTALDANTWNNNRTQPRAVTPPWRNFHQYTLSAGGPIVRGKTFFFALWDGFLPRNRTDINATVLTPCARNGIFRYFDNWSNGNVQQVLTTGATPRIAVVDFQGNPVAPATNPGSTTPHNGILRYTSIFGRVTNTPTRPDCSDAIVQGPTWDPYRTQMDPTGYVKKLLDVMPVPNNYEVGEGLNSAGYRWVLTRTGADNRFGFGEPVNRKQINIKIDHNFNTSHKLNGSYTYERNWSDNQYGVWPFRFPTYAFRRPQVLTVNFTSTLSPTLLNEVRYGMRRTGTNGAGSFTNPDTGEEAHAFFPNIGGFPLLPQLGMQPICVCAGQPFGARGETGALFQANINESTPLYTYADTLSWTRNAHSFKGGVEARFASSRLRDDVQANDFSAYLRAFGGETALTPILRIDSTNIPGLQGTSTTGNNLAMRSLMTLLTGSLSRVTQLYWLGSASRLDTWDDYRNSIQRERELNQQELSMFFKDDWKVSTNLTLNLGMRWEYYGVPWVSKGLTAVPDGGGDALFGYSGRGFDNWMRPGQRGELTKLIFVGPDSPNSSQSAWPKDFNNWGPAIGFSWQVPWFGAGQTTVRGGYQVSYLLGGGRFSTLDGALANPPGSSYTATFNGGPGLEYIDLTHMSRISPVPVPVAPMQPIPVDTRTVALTAFDSNYVTPNVQNLTLAVTRNVGRKLTVDMRYVGTLSRKLYGTLDVNASNFLYNGLKEAFDSARQGGESDLLNQMFNGIQIATTGCVGPSGTTVTCGPVGSVTGGVLQTGAMHLRAATGSSLRNNLADGNYLALANSLYTLNYSKAAGLNPSLPAIPAGVNGAVLRYNNFPENFVRANPQFSTATLQTNVGNTNYHSMQAEITMRPTAGVSVQGAYTWSRSLGRTGPFTNPVDRSSDYTLQAGHRLHNFRSNGTFNLPVGPGKLLLGNSSGPLARAIEGWTMSWILNLTSGAAADIGGANSLYANGVPDIVGPFDPSAGKVEWNDGALAGNYFGSAYTKVADPQCSAIAASLRSICTLNAVADSSGRIVLQNARPGVRGTLGQNVMELPGTWGLDGALSKRFQVGESRSFQLRVDALNVFNHPQPANPSLVLSGSNTPFGNIASKAGNRSFQAQLRVSF
jgi:hypothetical protein